MKRPDCAKSRGNLITAAVRPHTPRGDGAGPRPGGPIVRGIFAAGLAVIAAMSGCSQPEDKLPRQAVRGTVTLDGKPLEKGQISFIPEVQGANPVSGGSVISAGSYSIPQDKGLTPGKYKVAINAAADVPALAAGEAPGAPPKAKSKAAPLIPAQYNTQSTLGAEVKSGTNTINFEMTSK